MLTGQKIAYLRKKAGLSQDELAQKLFVSRELISKWETEKRNPDYRMICKIAEVLNTSADELYNVDENIFDEISECLSADCEITQEQLTAILNLFLKELSVTDRTIFISRYYYCHSSEQTSSLLSLRSGYIRKRLTAIRKKLTDFAKENLNG